MIGMSFFHPQSNTTGKVDATATHPDGKHIVRIEDHWLFLDDCKARAGDLIMSKAKPGKPCKPKPKGE